MKNIDQLKTPAEVQSHVREFVTRISESFGSELASVFAFGSVVTGDFDSQSDVNLMVVLTDLEIAELSPAIAGVRESIAKRRLAPRFVSKRNLQQSVKYFQIDFLEMRDAHVMLFGEDPLASLAVSPADLHWQIAYEIKSMRMRVKQQFWQFDGNAERMRGIVVNRFMGLVHLMRSTLLLLHGQAPVRREEILNAAVADIGIDRAAAAALLLLREDVKVPALELIRDHFTLLMDMIRILDDRLEGLP